MDIANPIIIALLLALIVALFTYAMLVPRNIEIFDPNINTKENAYALKALSKIGKELYATLPEGTSYQTGKRNPRIESLLIRSGNPWNLTVDEFNFIQIVSGFVGLLAGFATIFLLNMTTIHIPWFITLLAITIFGYFIPLIRYNEVAKSRDLEFKKELPEALDLIIISLSSGSTFANALRTSIPNMKESILKEEFTEVIKQIDTGKTVNDALLYFAGRAPNESIRTFVQAVRQANELNTPLIEVLRSRAEASREEFFALIHNKTAKLNSKMMIALTPTLLPALMLIAAAPAAISLMDSLGN